MKKQATTTTRSRKRASAKSEEKAPQKGGMQALMDAAGEDSMLGKKQRVLGRDLRSITLADIAILNQAHSPLIDGSQISEVPNITLDSCIFIYLLSVPIKEATNLVFGDPDILRDKALEMASEVHPSEVTNLTTTCINLLKEATSTQVKVEPRKGDKKEPGND